jgi:RimJ/RimL family protein N-acetyltransferase
MVQPTTVERVDAFWCRTLGVEAADLHTPGVRVRANPPERAEWRGIYALGFDKAVSVFVPDDLFDAAADGVADQDSDAVLEAAHWRSLLGTRVRTAFGPVVHHYRDERTGLDDLAAGRRLNPRDAEAFAVLRGAVPPEEWLAAGFTAQPAMLFAVFDGDRIVAAANLTAGPDAATDVGIVVHPEERGKGYALKVAALAARQALLMHGVARFRALATSASTMAIARKLGFEEYGRNLAVYLES